ncbi:MAG: Tol-Pal system protein TolB, partial [Curvibacter sp.]
MPIMIRRVLLCFWLLVVASFAQAQFRVEVSGVGLTQLPIAIAGFRGEDASPQKISAIVQADLERSGQFRSVASRAAPLDENARPDLAPWRQAGADSLLAGSVARLADGRFDVRFRLW